MKFEQIQCLIEKRQQKIYKYVDILCSLRAKELVDNLLHFRISALDMGMGTFSISGEDFDIVYDDGSVGKHDIQELVYFYDTYNLETRYNKFCWEPVDLNDHDSEILIELFDMCNWWIQESGGKDVKFITEE